VTPPPEAPVIRPMIHADLAAVLALTRRVPEAPWWNEAHIAQIVAPDAGTAPQFRRGWVSALSEKMIGFIVLQGLRIATGARREAECEIESIVVDPGFRRKGVGHALLGASIEWCRKNGVSIIRLEVRSRNMPAIGLYQHAGFAAVGTRSQYYRAPDDDAVLMALDVPH
jgi:ribosomal-protein-alanine N-acetyltransferase